MSALGYGKVILTGLKLLNYRVDPVHAGTQFVSARHAITVRGVLNPALNSYDFGEQSDSPVRVNGLLAPVTWAAIYNALILPRKFLVLEAAGFTVTISPPEVQQAVNPQVPATARAGTAAALAAGRLAGPGGQILQAVAGLLNSVDLAATSVERRGGFTKLAVCDVNNGPVVNDVRVTENIGDKTFIVEATFITWLRDIPPQAKTRPNPAPEHDKNSNFNETHGLTGTRNTFPFGGTNPHPVPATIPRSPRFVQSPLSTHEWTMRSRVDQDFFTTRIVNGRCVFRRDVLEANKLIPDQLRYWLGHPVPQGMMRQGVNVVAQPDGVSYEYEIIDRDRVLRFDPNVFTRVECAYTTDVTEKGILDTLFPGGNFSILGLANLAAGQLLNIAGNVAGQIANLLGGQALPQVLQDFGSFLVTNNFGLSRPIPLKEYHIIGRFWGHPEKDMFWLDYDAELFITNRFREALQFANPIFNVPAPGPLGALAPIVAVQSPIQLATIKKRKTVDQSGKFLEIDWRVLSSILTGAAAAFIDGRRPKNRTHISSLPPEPYPILNDPMRGTNLSACVAAALRNPEDAWQQPQDPPWIRNSSVYRRVGGEYFSPPNTQGAPLTGITP